MRCQLFLYHINLTEEQYKYLMMGLNPLDPKIKDVDPKNIY